VRYYEPAETERLAFSKVRFCRQMDLSRPLTDRHEIVLNGSSLKTYFRKFFPPLKFFVAYLETLADFGVIVANLEVFSLAA